MARDGSSVPGHWSLTALILEPLFLTSSVKCDEIGNMGTSACTWVLMESNIKLKKQRFKASSVSFLSPLMASQTDQMNVPGHHTSSSKIFLTQTAVYLKNHSMVRPPRDKYTQGNPSLVVVILKVPRGLIILQWCCKPCQDALLNQSLQSHWANWPFPDRVTSLGASLLHSCWVLTETIKHNWPLLVQ